jgi:hypothetical protein
VDAHFLVKIAGGRLLCAAAEQILETVSVKVSIALNWRIRRFYSVHVFHSVARLDVPTWDDPVIAAQIQNALPDSEDSNSIAWTAIKSVVQTVTIFVRLFSQTAVLVSVLHEQRDGFLLSLLSFSGVAFTCLDSTNAGDIHGGKWRLFLRSWFVLRLFLAWAATTHNNDYIRMEGLKRLVGSSKHRKELVAGGLSEYLTAGASNPLLYRYGQY